MNTESRKYVIIVFIFLVGISYVIRLFYMQILDESWMLRAQEIAEKRKEITPNRGAIFDRNNKQIVSNKVYYNLMFVEDKLHNFDANAFAKMLGWTKEQVLARFEEIKKGEGTYYNRHSKKRTSNYLKSRAYPFLKELTLDEILKIAPFLDKFPGFYEEATSMRSYPFANGANILGYLSEVTGEEIKKDRFYKPANNIGRTGLERYYEKELRGRKGIKYVVASAMNNTIQPYANGKYDTVSKPGANLILGIDISLQAYCEKLMQNKKGCIVSIEPSSGEILSFVSAPSFDPNLLIGKRNISQNYPKLNKDPNLPLYPRPLASEYPPGSIFKLVQGLVGMQEGVITENTGFPCNKSMVGCHGHAMATDIPKAVQYSCNPYFYYVMKKIIQQGKKKNTFADAEIGLAKWVKYMNSFGLGIKLQTDITGIKKGLIPGPAFYDKWYGHHNWQFNSIQSISIGQGEVKLTPLQMANIAVIIANKGWFYTPHFVKSISGKGPLERLKIKNYTMVESKYFPAVIEGMRRVVNEPGGTANSAKLTDIIIAGKTGTVQNPHGKDHSVFIAFAPLDNPKIAIAVFIENSGFGGTWAAPTASLVIEKYLTGKITNESKEKRIIDAKLSNIEIERE
ncbi:MAG: peptidoglycan glycosyltransferase [Bacteroidetes bacterium]|nr:peptidoglycan glycosyltransferase [Bacteroidota bacterium]